MKHLFRKLLYSGFLTALCLGFVAYTSRGLTYGIVVGSGVLLLFVIIAFAMEKLFKWSDQRLTRTKTPPNIKQAKRGLVIIGVMFFIGIPFIIRAIFLYLPHLSHLGTRGMYLVIAFLELFVITALVSAYISLVKSKKDNLDQE